MPKLPKKTNAKTTAQGTRKAMGKMSGKVSYLKTAVLTADFPLADRPEVALAGRSNAGKSSFLNALTQQDVAHVSSMPGKTQTLNFFDVGQHYRFVDMPGYGFARRGNKEVETWQPMIENYLIERESLVGVLLFIDIRRQWEVEEEQLRQWLEYHGIPIVVALTKSDKLLLREVETARMKMEENAVVAFPVSSLKGTGLMEVEEYIYRTWIKPVLEETE